MKLIEHANAQRLLLEAFSMTPHTNNTKGGPRLGQVLWGLCENEHPELMEWFRGSTEDFFYVEDEGEVLIKFLTHYTKG